MSEEVASLTFQCFLQRAAVIISTLDLAISSTGDLLNLAAVKLAHVATALLKMHNNPLDKARKALFLGVLARERAFVYSALQLTSKAMEFYGEYRLFDIGASTSCQHNGQETHFISCTHSVTTSEKKVASIPTFFSIC